MKSHQRSNSFVPPEESKVTLVNYKVNQQNKKKSDDATNDDSLHRQNNQ